MRPGAGLHSDEAGITARKDLRNLAAAELALQRDRALRVDAVELNDGLGQIDADGGRAVAWMAPSMGL